MLRKHLDTTTFYKRNQSVWLIYYALEIGKSNICKNILVNMHAHI